MDATILINACDAKFQRAGLGGLTSAERVLALCSVVSFEVELGGVGSFFHNSSGAFASETIEALLALGATHEAWAVRKGRDLLKSNSWQALAQSGAFEPLTKHFHSAPQDLFGRMCAYAELHAGELHVA